MKLLNQFDPPQRAFFEGIQGNILKSHGRHYTANVFIRGNDGMQDKAKDWLKSLADSENSLVQSAYVQLRKNVLFKESNKMLDTGLFACVHISAKGYDFLFGNGARNRFSDPSFQVGMQEADLQDPNPEHWETGLRADNHFMLLLAHADTAKLEKAIEQVYQKTQFFGSITTIEKGEAQFNDEGAGIEHFGYVDGVSQPLFFDDEWETYKVNNNIRPGQKIKFDPRADADLVLLKDPFVENDNNAMGSYFVFRKLEQNVKGFKLAESELASRLGLKEGDEERAGAMLVGRWEDGTPVELSGHEGMIHNSVFNNFDYDPANNARCPFHGHIRKTNPRSGLDGGGMPAAKKRIMARRGIPFGKRKDGDGPNDGHLYNKPEGGVGLLFMSYQASIEDQFEFIQKQWANSPKRPANTANPAGADVGSDPIIGQFRDKSGEPLASTGEFATRWDTSDPKEMEEGSFASFVTMKGGEYFFAPSMAFLREIQKIEF